MLYPQSLTDAKITVKYKTEKDNATFFNGSKEVALTGEWTNGQSIRYILTLPVGAEKMSVNTTYDEDWNATNIQINITIPRSAMKHRIIPSIICDFICGAFLPVDNQPSSIIKYP